MAALRSCWHTAGAPRDRPGQAVHAVPVHRQPGLAGTLLDHVVAALQANGSGLRDGNVDARLAHGNVEPVAGRAAQGGHQGGVGFHLAIHLAEHALGVADGSAALCVELLRALQVGGVLAVGQLDRLRGVHQRCGLRQCGSRRSGVRVGVELAHAVGDLVDLVGQVGAHAARQDLRGAGDAKHVHHAAVDQGIAARRVQVTLARYPARGTAVYVYRAVGGAL